MRGLRAACVLPVCLDVAPPLGTQEGEHPSLHQPQAWRAEDPRVSPLPFCMGILLFFARKFSRMLLVSASGLRLNFCDIQSSQDGDGQEFSPFASGAAWPGTQGSATQAFVSCGQTYSVVAAQR